MWTRLFSLDEELSKVTSAAKAVQVPDPTAGLKGLLHPANLHRVVTRLRNPSAAHHQIAVVKHHSLARRDGALRIIKRHAHFAVRRWLQHRRRGLMAMADLGSNAHRALSKSDLCAGPSIRRNTRLAQSFNGDPIYVTRDQRTREQIIVAAHGHLTFGAVDVDHVKRRACGHAQSLALTDG